MTSNELCDELDKELEPILNRLREKAHMDNVSFSGAVTGFLLKTGINLAVKGGCPRKVLTKSLLNIIQEGYGS